MTEQPAGGTWLVATAARYATRMTLFTSGGAPATVLKADARRWAIKVLATGGGGSMPIIVPAPLPPGLPAVALGLSEQEWEFWKYPAAVIGEWVCPGGAGLNCLVLETLYVGE